LLQENFFKLVLKLQAFKFFSIPLPIVDFLFPTFGEKESSMGELNPDPNRHCPLQHKA
jgi:hypothetical protein